MHVTVLEIGKACHYNKIIKAKTHYQRVKMSHEPWDAGLGWESDNIIDNCCGAWP